MVSKKILVPAIAVLLAGSAVAGISMAYAQSGNNPFTGLAQAVAQKFHLNQDDVQNTITSYMQQHKANFQANMQARIKNRLDTEVQQGKITSIQEQAIINELNSLKSKYNLSSLRTMTPQERQQTMQNMQNDLKTWAEQNGIDMSLIPFGFGMSRRFGWMGRHFMMGPTPTPTP